MNGELFGLAGTVVLGLLMLAYPVASAQDVPEWQAEKTKALARIESQRCYGSCTPIEVDKTARTGTGFLVRLDGFDRPVVVTALHVVAGANFITLAFTEINESKFPVEVLAVDQDADIAILAAPDAAASIEPLTLEDPPAAGSMVIVYGCKEGAFKPISDVGRVKLMAPAMLGQLPLGKTFGILLQLGYPDLELPIVTLEEVLTPGDSGAPVFNLGGGVVGMAHGGLPSAAAQVTWMVPASRILHLRPEALEVSDLRRWAGPRPPRRATEDSTGQTRHSARR
jgi:S1-C subfamily serine protease